jgi:DNA-binding transcriptional regulator GbsR (MarR family)
MNRSPNSLDQKTTVFVEDLGLLISESGIPRGVGRILALLFICVPKHQSAEDIQSQLKMSTGSVSTYTTLLEKMGWLKKTTFNGDRKIYYELDPNCWQKLVESRLRQTQRGVKIAEDGLKIRKNDERLLVLKKMYSEVVNVLIDMNA